VSGFAVVRTEEKMADELAALQEACFPTLAADERIRAEHYRAHVRVFPEGQHAVVETATGRVVAASTDFRTTIDFHHYPHRYIDVHRGYHVYGLIPDYLEDPSCANYGVFVVWRNSDRRGPPLPSAR